LVEAWLGHGNVYTELKQYDNAFAAYDRALSLDPDLKYVEGLRLISKMHLCDWTNLEEEIHRLLARTQDQKPATPFVLLSIPSSATDQLRCATAFVADQGSFPALWKGEIYSHDRIRIAYLSSDFHEHATAYLMAGFFEQHDKERFEATAISFGPAQKSSMRQRIAGAVENFVDVRNESDQQIAELIRQREIDIVIDLKGFTADARHEVLARRAAPVQVNYLGYPGTMGADFIDYIIADGTIIPKEHFASYAERVVWLPDSYQVNDWQRPVSTAGPNRQQCGLPENAFVFCCFNNPYKILPETFDIWMRLLRANENSVLWLFEGHPSATANLRREAEKRGVSAERLIFAPQMALADHLARHRCADLFLDTLPYNAHTTASDALWTGVPVLTCLGTTFAGRVAGSLLRAVDLDELITHSLEEYEAMAIKLAQEPPHLAALKDKLVRNRSTFSLFDTKRFTRHIESAFVRMWERYRQGIPPEAFTVVPPN
jgi:predicted O-linked N-acetylglucosamine transferase (SPINDLY family)